MAFFCFLWSLYSSLWTILNGKYEVEHYVLVLYWLRMWLYYVRFAALFYALSSFGTLDQSAKAISLERNIHLYLTDWIICQCFQFFILKSLTKCNKMPFSVFLRVTQSNYCHFSLSHWSILRIFERICSVTDNIYPFYLTECVTLLFLSLPFSSLILTN